MSSYRKFVLAALCLMLVLNVVSCISTTNRVNAPAAEPTFAPRPTVNATLAQRVKAKCIAQIEIISKNNKPSWTVTDTRFTGDVEEVALLRKKTAYEVTFTWAGQFSSPVTKTCRVDSTFESVDMRPL